MCEIKNKQAMCVGINASEAHALTTAIRYVRMINADIDGAARCRDESNIFSGAPIDIINKTVCWVASLSEINELPDP
jgi:hypothetical protein